MRCVPWNGHAITRWLTVTRRSAAEMTRGKLTDGDFPTVTMKAKVEHVVPLSANTLCFIEALTRRHPRVFTHSGAGPRQQFRRGKERLDQLSGVSGHLHD